MAKLNFLQSLPDGPALERTNFELKPVQNDSNRPNIRRERIAEATHSLRRNVIRGAAGLALEFPVVRQLASKAEISQLDVVISVDVEVAKFETSYSHRYSLCSMFLEWM